MKLRIAVKTIITGFFTCVFFFGLMGGATPLSALAEDEVSYPTLITALNQNGVVKIVFDPIDFDPTGSQPGGPTPSVSYRIYRSKQRMTEAKDLAQAAVVADFSSENIPFRDRPESDGKYYYAVTVLRDGSETIDLLPYQNTTMNPVDYAPPPGCVSDILISAVDRTSVEISFSPLGGGYTYSLFQSGVPFEDTHVDTAHTVSNNEECCFQVKIVEGEPYYFLVTTTNRMGIENKTVTPGANTNIEPFLVQKKEEKKQVEVKAVPVKPKPNASDLIERALRRHFYRGLYAAALKEFETILKRRDLSSAQRGRSYFYVGQCYYYSGNYEKAIRFFILCKSTGRHASESELWIERCLEKVE